MTIEHRFSVIVEENQITIVEACCDMAAKIKGFDYLKLHGLSTNFKVQEMK